MTQRKNILLAIDKSDPVWPSTRTILPLMIRCLQDAFPDAAKFFFDGLDPSPNKIRNWKSILTKDEPCRIIFLTQKAPPVEFLSILSQWDPHRKTAIVFYFCGSLPMWVYLWHPLENLLTGFRVVFCCPSESDARVSKGFFKSVAVSVIPYALPDRVFFKSRRWKKKGAVTIVYAGRIVPQKGLHHLLLALHTFFQGQNQDWRLEIYGTFDNVTVLPIGSHPPGGSAYQRIVRSLIRQRKLEGHVRFHAPVKRARLRPILEEADLFVSLSSFHPEEFGLSPAEAIRCGCPCVISAWSGYHAFSRFAPSVLLVPPVWQNGFIAFQQKDIVNAFRKWKEVNPGEKERMQLSRRSLRWNSEQAVIRQLKSVFTLPLKPYRGLSEKGIKISRMVERKQSVFLYNFPLSSKQRKSYMEFYVPYFRAAAKKK